MATRNPGERALTDDQVRDLRRLRWLEGWTFTRLAKRFRVSLYTAHTAAWGDAAYRNVPSPMDVAQIIRHAHKQASGRRAAA